MMLSRGKLFAFLCFCFFSIVIFGMCLYAANHRVKTAKVLWDSTRLSGLATLLDPSSRDLHFNIGNHYFSGKHYDLKKATRHYKIAIQADNDFLEPHYQLGRIYFLQGKYEDALIEISAVLKINREFSKGYYMLGLIGGYSGDDIQAIYGFSEYILRDPKNWAGYNDLAWILFRQGDFVKAQEVVEAGLKQSPANPWLHNLHGAVFISIGKYDQAKVSLNLAKEAVSRMNANDWGRAYPGNDPAIYAQGLNEMRATIDKNLSRLDNETLSTSKPSGIY